MQSRSIQQPGQKNTINNLWEDQHCKTRRKKTCNYFQNENLISAFSLNLYQIIPTSAFIIKYLIIVTLINAINKKKSLKSCLKIQRL